MVANKQLFVPMNEEKSSWNSLWINLDKLTSEIFVHKALHWALYHMWFQNTFELYDSLLHRTLLKEKQ